MNKRSTTCMSWVALIAVGMLALPLVASANVVDEEKEIYIARPLTTEPAWTQTGFYFNSMLFDLPNAVSRPNAQVGFMFTPGFTWSILDILELNVGFPLVLNPDDTGDQELDESKQAKLQDENYRDPPYYDSSPDFDLPGITLGLKGNVWGKKGEDRFFLAVGVMTSIPLGSYDKWSTNFMGPKTAAYHSNSTRVAPYVSVAYSIGRFSPQLQVGGVLRFDEEHYDPDNAPVAGEPVPSKGYGDFFFNLALPFSFLYERTAPMLEINGVFGEQGTQLFITPAVTFLPKGSPALISFACQIPILDDGFRHSEGFRFLVNFSYRLDALAIPALGSDEEEEGSDETPPAGW